MTRLYLIRHGESLSNVEGTFTGQLDIPLSEAGREQARCTAAFLQDVPLEAVYTSDLSRAYETGCIIAQTHSLMAVPTTHLREVHGGLWQGKKYADLEAEFPESYGIWRRQIGLAVPPEGEPVARLQQRVLAFVQSVVCTHPDGCVALATHATPIRVLECLWRGLPLEEMHTVPWVSNASVTIAECDGTGNFRIIQRDLSAHLGKLYTELPTTV